MSMMLRWLYGKSGFVAANVLVMIILHGNSRQFWPKIPLLSLRDESVFEHCRLLFNTLLVVTLGQIALRRLSVSRRLPRVCTLIVLPLALPLLIAFGQRVLRLQGRAGETYNLALVPLLPIGAAALEDGLVAMAEKQKH